MVKWHFITAVGTRAMAHKSVLFALFLAVIGAGLTHVAAADKSPPVIIKTLISDEVVDPEGNQTTTLHVEKHATNESAAHNIAQYTLEFSESMETQRYWKLSRARLTARYSKSTERRSSRRRRLARRRYRNSPIANRRSWSFPT